MDTVLTVLSYVALNVFVLAFIGVFIGLINYLSLTPRQRIERKQLRQEREQHRKEIKLHRQEIEQERKEKKLIQRERDRKEKNSISTSCPDCGSFVSTMAYACPKCGRLSKVAASRAKTQSCAMILLIWVLFGIIFNGFIYGFINGFIKGFISGFNNR